MELLHLKFRPQNQNTFALTRFQENPTGCIMLMLTKDSNVLKIIALAICV